MDEGEPIDMTAMRRKALEAQAELTSLAALYSLALRVREDPSAASPDDVGQLAEGVLKHVKPYIGKRQGRPS